MEIVEIETMLLICCVRLVSFGKLVIVFCEIRCRIGRCASRVYLFDIRMVQDELVVLYCVTAVKVDVALVL
jgi:hypothetical protein